MEKLREYSAAKRLRALPTPLEFASYCFAAGNLLAGPFFEATDYFDYVRREVRPPPPPRVCVPAAWTGGRPVQIARGYALLNSKAVPGRGRLQGSHTRTALMPTFPLPHAAAAHRCCWLQGAWDESDPAKRIPNPLLPGLLRFAKGIACALVWTKLSSRFSAGLMESAWFFQETSLVQRLGVIWAIGVVSRFKY